MSGGRRAAGGVVLAGALALAGPAVAAPRVSVMVVGRSHVLRGARPVLDGPATAAVGRRRCAVGAGTPLAALLRVGLAVRIRDYGACSRRAADASGLFVFRVGPDANAGRSGWVYKVGQRLGSAGAGDPAGPFGRGPLRSGARILWFWCAMGARGCQRTLGVATPARAGRGAPVRVVVRAYDDGGRGRPLAGAEVRLGGSATISGAGGVAVLRAPGRRGRYAVSASASGTVPAFPEVVSVR